MVGTYWMSVSVCVCLRVWTTSCLPQAALLVLPCTVVSHLHLALESSKLDSLLFAHRVGPIEDAVARLNVDQSHFSRLTPVHHLVREEEAFPACTYTDGIYSSQITIQGRAECVYVRTCIPSPSQRQRDKGTHIRTYPCTHTQIHTQTFIHTNKGRKLSVHALCEALAANHLTQPLYICTYVYCALLILDPIPILIPLYPHGTMQHHITAATASLHPPQHQHLVLPHSLLPQRLQRAQPLHCIGIHTYAHTYVHMYRALQWHNII